MRADVLDVRVHPLDVEPAPLEVFVEGMPDVDVPDRPLASFNFRSTAAAVW